MERCGSRLLGLEVTGLPASGCRQDAPRISLVPHDDRARTLEREPEAERLAFPLRLQEMPGCAAIP